MSNTLAIFYFIAKKTRYYDLLSRYYDMIKSSNYDFLSRYIDILSRNYEFLFLILFIWSF